MQKMYDSQCGQSPRLQLLRHADNPDEAQRLRDMLRDRDNEIHRIEASLAEHEADEEKVRALHSRQMVNLTLSIRANCILSKPM